MARKNLRKIPTDLLAKIASFEVDDVVVACAKKLGLEDIAKYVDLGLRLENGKLVFPIAQVPRPDAGRFSNANLHGRDVVRKDLPKTTKTFSWEVPNWGDWSKGSHTQSFTRDVYHRDFNPPKEVKLLIELLENSGSPDFLVKFSIDQIISRRAPDFAADLLYNLNILQENVHSVDVFSSTSTLADYAATIHVEWEILPPGKVDEVLKKMLLGKNPVPADQQQEMKVRLAVLHRLKPQAFIAGTNEFLRYFGAKFADDFVAFENLNYGNAIYVMFENWATLSQRSRIDLLKGPRDGFERIEHRDGWEDRLESLLTAYKERKKGGKGS